MSSSELLKYIPEVSIKNYRKDASCFLILNLDELNEKQFNINSPHRLSYYQLTLITEGEGQIVLDSRKYKYSPRTLIAISKGCIETAVFNEGTGGYTILFSEEYINKNPEDIWWINNLKLFDLSTNPLIRNLTDSEYIELLIYLKKLMTESMFKNDFAKENIIKNLLKTLILICERIKRKGVFDEIKNADDRYYVVEFRKKLEENFYKSKSVHYYADFLNITPKKLNKITHDFWGKNAKNIIEERLILEIKRLLIHTDKPIKEIGHLLGFSEATNFNKFFKKYVNETPACFRTLNKYTKIP